MGYLQRFTFNEELLDDGYAPQENEADKKRLSSFNLKEFDVITLDGARIRVLKIPQNEELVVEGVDPMKDTIFDLKKRVAETTRIHASKARLLHPETLEEYVGDSDDTKKLYEYGFVDGDVVKLEKAKLDFRVILPSHERLEKIVDPRKDDLQSINDFIFQKYYQGRVVPKEDMRPMLFRSTKRVLNDEPGETKLIDLGVVKDNDYFTLLPCYITIETPTKDIICPNADPFHDTLDLITNFVTNEGINVDGLHIQFNGQKMTDYKSVLYDLGMKQDSKVIFME
jgi:hypothetical protein